MPLTFRRLFTVILLSGTAAGLLLSALQYVTVTPLIRQAEAYQHAASTAGHGVDDGWEPNEGIERTTYTVLGTTLMGIAFSALLFGVALLFQCSLSVRSGLCLGMAGFACFVLSPALGLPPMPPGVVDTDLHAAQSWWLGTALATAAGLWAISGLDRRAVLRLAGLLLVATPHILGAPAAHIDSSVPVTLVTQFVVASIATRAVFWLTLGGMGGWLFSMTADSSPRQSRATSRMNSAASRIPDSQF